MATRLPLIAVSVGERAAVAGVGYDSPGFERTKAGVVESGSTGEVGEERNELVEEVRRWWLLAAWYLVCCSGVWVCERRRSGDTWSTSGTSSVSEDAACWAASHCA